MQEWLHFATQKVRPSDRVVTLQNLLFEKDEIFDKLGLEVRDEAYWFYNEELGAIGFANNRIEHIEHLEGQPPTEYHPIKEEIERGELSFSEKMDKLSTSITQETGTQAVPIPKPFFKEFNNEIPNKIKLDYNDSVCFVAEEEVVESTDTDGKYCYLVQKERLDETLIGSWVLSAENERRLARDGIDVLRDIESQGFVELGPRNLEQEPGEPVRAWRTGFEWEDIAAGYALERERPNPDREERRSVNDEIIDRLGRRENLIVLGEGASGKSTVCKHVGFQWHDAERGPVFYRESSTFKPFDDPDILIKTIRAAEGEPLIVLEDAADETTAPIYEVIKEFKDEADVTFLLDARETDWRESDSLLGDPTLELDRQSVSVVPMPEPDLIECQRAKDHFEKITNQEVHYSGERLYEVICNADIGRMLLLAYRLTISPDDAKMDRAVSALHQDVRITYDDLNKWAGKNHIPIAVGVSINILNAARLPIHSVFIHALASNHDDHHTIDRTLNYLMGKMLYEGENGHFRTSHEIWSKLFLEQMMTQLNEHQARNLFEKCVNALFEFVGNLERSKRIVNRWFRESPKVFEILETSPELIARLFVFKLGEMGRKHPKLAPLYGTSDTSRIRLPRICPDHSNIAWLLHRGQTHWRHADFEAAEQEFKMVKELTETTEETALNPSKRHTYRSWASNRLGVIAQSRGNLKTAEDYLQESLITFREIDDQAGEANCLNNLGATAIRAGDLKTAENYLQESLDISREFGNKHQEAQNLSNLGLIHMERGDFEKAEENIQKSRTISRNRGDHPGEAQGLHNLASIAYHRGNLENAKRYFKESITGKQEADDRHGVANSLHNLGKISQSQGNQEEAEDYYQKSLAIFQEIGDLLGRAQVLQSIGVIVGIQGNDKTASEYFEQAAQIYDEQGAIRDLLKTYGNLATAYERQSDIDKVKEICKTALSIIHEADVPELEDEKLDFLVRRARFNESASTIRELYQYGMLRALRKEEKDAMEILHNIWTRRDQFNSNAEIYSVILAAGVGYVTITKFLDFEETPEDYTEVLDSIKPYRDSLSSPASALYTYLTEDELDTTPEDLRETLNTKVTEISLNNLKIDEIETLAYAKILEDLLDQDDE